MEILLVNHKKSQCGIYELGVRIYDLFDKNILDVGYCEVGSLEELRNNIEIFKPKYILYNYYTLTLPFLNSLTLNSLTLNSLFPNIKHIGIIHDPIGPLSISSVENIFDYWIIHDDTNETISKKKFLTVRPIRRFERTTEIDTNNITIGTHGFNTSPWKKYDYIIDIIQKDFDFATINMNITVATYGDGNQLSPIEMWKRKIYKDGIKLNITHDYFNTEMDLINFLSKNTMNIYFYQASNPYQGVAASADLAVSAQSSLVVNSTHMYRHFHKYIGSYEMENDLQKFLDNESRVKEIYNLWSPERMTNDYKKMIESI